MDFDSSCILYRMKRKKIHYVPGLISLIGLPILIFILSQNPDKAKNAVRIFLPSDEKDESGQMRKFSKYYLYKIVENKKIIQVELDNVPEERYLTGSRLKFITREIERLKFTNDNSFVLKIHLSDSSTLGEFVWMVNQTLVYQIKRWGFVDDTFYFFNSPPDTVKEELPVVKTLNL